MQAPDRARTRKRLCYRNFMEVFLIPVGLGRHELYCEVREDPATGSTGSPQAGSGSQSQAGSRPGDAPKAPVGRLERMRIRLREMIADAEAESRGAHDPRRPRAQHGWMHRVRQRVLRYVAERIAEQRLLWHLRRQAEAILVFPEDMTETDAMRVMRGFLERDLTVHRRWLMVDSVLLVLSGALVVVPGPNIIGFYFLFRVVGHYLSMRGARHGLQKVSWHTRPNSALKTLRGAATMEPPAREQQVRHVAMELRLQHLVQFFERTAVAP
ncbi:MAG: hypothetical protein HY654_10950 [Acidobacteria bacterium]|nr:hypothetical protein [Acidobacteriota bacterium]